MCNVVSFREIFDKLKPCNDGLRDYQISAKNDIYEAWCEVDSVMLQMPTGTGKTHVFTSIVNDLLEYYRQRNETINILVVAHKTEIIDQISRKLNGYGIKYGIIQGDRYQESWHRVQVASIQSILNARNIDNARVQQFQYIIVDEAHHAIEGNDSYRRVFETFPNAKKLGVTATPWRFNNAPFTGLFDRIICSEPVSWFIDQNYLADFDYVSIPNDSEVQQRINSLRPAQTGDYTDADLDTNFNTDGIRAKLFKSYKKYANGKKGIIYAINKRHAANIAKLYSDNGVPAVAIDCDTPREERDRLVQLFRDGKIKVLVNVNIFTEGFDCPDVDFIQLARPTRSLTLYLQQVGRGLRYVPGKEKAIIIDNVGLYNSFGLPDADRDWEEHFYGHEVDYQPNDARLGTRINIETEDDGTRYEEGDEQMVVIRGSDVPELTVETPTSDDSETSDIVTPEDLHDEPADTQEKSFDVCGRFRVTGDASAFEIYTLRRRNGRATGETDRLYYKCEASEEPMVFWKEHVERNREIVDDDTLLEMALSKIAKNLGIGLDIVLDVNRLALFSRTEIGDTVSLFDVLKMLHSLEPPIPQTAAD